MHILFICLLVAFFFGGPQLSFAQQPATGDGLFLDGVKAYITDKPQQAEQFFKQYLQTNPNSAEAHYYLSGLYAEKKDLLKAKAAAKKALEGEPDNKWYKERLALIAGMNRDYKEAAQLYTDLGRKEKFGEDYLLKAAMIHTNMEEYPQAIQLLDEVESKLGYDEELQLRKIQIYRKANDFTKVEELARRMISENPKDAGNYSQLIDFFLERGENVKAKTLLDEGLKVLPNDIVLQLSLAQYYEKTGDKARYEEVIKKTITNKNLDAGTQVSLLIPYLQQLGADSSKRSEGLALAAQLADQHQNNADIQALYGDLLMYESRNDSAAEMYKKAIQLDATKYPVWQQLMFAYSDKASADSLLKYSEKAILHFPNQAMAHYLNGVGHFHKSNYTYAIRSVNRAIDLQPDEEKDLLSDMYSLLGDIHHAAKNYALSDSSYQQSLKMNPDNASVLNNYAYYLSLRKEHLEEAEKMSKRSLDLRPGEATFLDTYGWILYQQGKFLEARKYIEQAINTNPNSDGTLYEHLGDILYKLGNVQEAVRKWELALQKGVEDDTLLQKKIRDKKLYES